MELLKKLRKDVPIALAISGGVDSMAMAFSVVQSISPDRIHALTVDHGARSESHLEALAVGNNLKQIGIYNHHILKIKWPQNVVPQKGFELQARVMRRQLLLDKCHDLSVKHLCMAHNWGDQLETFLFRMLKGSSLYGMAGMNDVTYDSSIVDPNTDGPVTLVRPVIELQKSDLYALCQANNVSWVEDPTNKDVTLTVRNSVRHLLEQKSLPKALSHNDLTATLKVLREKRFTTVAQVEKHITEARLNGDLEVNEKWGSVQCKLPQNFKSKPPSFQCLYLYQLLQIVSPLQMAYRLSSIDDLQQRLYSHEPGEVLPTYGNTVIKYTKQPCDRDIIAISRARIFRNQQNLFKKRLLLNTEWTPWFLFDNRYWLRMKSQSQANLAAQISLLFDIDPVVKSFDKSGIKLSEPKTVLHGQPYIEIIQKENVTPFGFPVLGKFDESQGVQVEWKFKQLVQNDF